MAFRADLEKLVTELEEKPSGVLNENIVKVLKNLADRVKVLEEG
jgi:hypothetical protein